MDDAADAPGAVRSGKGPADTPSLAEGIEAPAVIVALAARVFVVDDLATALDHLSPELEFPPEAMRVKRGKKSKRQKVALPEGYLDDRLDETPPDPEAERDDSGG